MARYIDADAAVEEARLAYCKDCNSYNGVICRSCGFDDAMSYIEGYPEADVVAVVRCKDCKYNAFAQPNGTIHCHARKNLICEYRNADDFCSYGERRE